MAVSTRDTHGSMECMYLFGQHNPNFSAETVMRNSNKLNKSNTFSNLIPTHVGIYYLVVVTRLLEDLKFKIKQHFRFLNFMV